MARFTPSAILLAGGGFVNPLLNANATAFSSRSLRLSLAAETWRGGNPESRAFDICITPGCKRVCPAREAINLDNVKCIGGKEDETKI